MAIRLVHVLRDELQNELFQHLARDKGEVDRHVVSWVLLPALSILLAVH